MKLNAYNELNLRKNASELEIRTAFRKLAKEHHPDTSSNGPADADRFRRACQAYRELLGRTVLSGPKRAQAPAAGSSAAFVFDGQRKAGLDVYMDIALVRPQNGAAFKITLPWTAYEACPRCFGQGQTLGRLNADGNVYRPQTCPKCQGQGSISRGQRLSVTVTPQMAERGKFRLRGAGGYLPDQAKRGDLIVNLRWVDRLPAGH
jgi:DnaJ-class molecular chaperone